VQEVLLESLDLKLEGAQACRKLSLLDHLPKDKQNRTGALISNPEMRSFGFGFG